MTPNPGGDLVWHASIADGVITTIAVVLRLLARKKSKAEFGADDLLITVSLLPQYSMIIVGHLSVYQGGLGLPIGDIEPMRLPIFLKYTMIGNITASITITMVKVAILVLYRRIFDTYAFRQRTSIIGAICVAWFIVVFFTDIFQCRPFNAAFNPNLVSTDQCIDLQDFYWGVVSSNLGLDVVMLCLPISEVWKLQMPKRQKMMLSGVFMLGGFVCVSAAMRLVAISNLKKEEITLSVVSEYLWTQIEPGTAIVCACIVTYKPLLTTINFPSSKISGLFSRRKSKASSDDDEAGIIDSEIWHFAPQTIDSDVRRWQGLNKKAAKGGLHVINIKAQGTGVSLPEVQSSNEEDRNQV